MRREALAFLAVACSACAQIHFAPAAYAGPHDALIAKHAAANGVPEHLVRRVIRIESRGNAASVHAGNYGLMQIRLGTARSMGYSGQAGGLLDPETNLTFAVRYLAGAYRAAGCDPDRAVHLYQRGYYGAAKRECGAAASAPVQLAQAESRADAKARRRGGPVETKTDAAAPAPVDVIKPKVVRTETIAPTKPHPGPARPVGKFEPARIAPPPAQPVASVAPAGTVELASVPLPPVRPEFDLAAKQTAHPDHQPPKRAGKKIAARPHNEPRSKTETDSRTDSKFKFADPAEVVSYLKKLVTPDKKPRKRAAESDAEAFAVPPSQAQPLE